MYLPTEYTFFKLFYQKSKNITALLNNAKNYSGDSISTENILRSLNRFSKELQTNANSNNYGYI